MSSDTPEARILFIAVADGEESTCVSLECDAVAQRVDIPQS